MARVELPESKLRARRRRRRVMRLWFFGGIIFILLLRFIGVSHLPFLQVETVNVKGTETVSPEELQELTTEQLGGAYGWLFSRGNIFIYPKQEIMAAVYESDPVIKNVEVEAENFSTINVHVVERKPKALWCSGTCYFMDEDGVVYEQAPEFSAPVYVKYEGRASGENLPKQFLSGEKFLALSALVDALGQTRAEVRIERVIVDQNADAHVRFADGFELKFATGDDGGDVYERFTLALESEPFKNHALSQFEYLDLRFGDKLYYKLRDE